MGRQIGIGRTLSGCMARKIKLWLKKQGNIPNTDNRKEFRYRGIRVIPQAPKGLLHRHWMITGARTITASGLIGWVLVSTKADAHRVIDAWLNE